MGSGDGGAACRLIVGLGNPGPEYEGTRHNAGFAVAERLLSKMPKGFERMKGHSSIFWKGRYAGQALLVQEPTTFMNLSGEAVASLAGFEGLAPEEVMVVYDDMDLPLGKMRMRPGGGSGGHNGVKSIIESLKSESFPRLRLGIGRSLEGPRGKDYVLSAFEPGERELFEKLVDSAADALILALRRGVRAAMNAYNAKDLAAEAAKPEAKD